MSELSKHEDILLKFDRLCHELRIYMNNVVQYIGEHPDLANGEGHVVHSYKSRLKNREHLRAKIDRKISSGREINSNNFHSEITDLAGVRILHLFQQDFGSINQVIIDKVNSGDWHLHEQPKAYTWDPESAEYFRGFNLSVSEKPTAYTSVHYLVRPRADSPICCEIQVRTLFEEIWGEVDHQINYPQPTDNVACREQIRVLSKLIGAGSRLLDSLQRVHKNN